MDWNFQELRKSASDRMLNGICGGLGEHTPVPALVWRVLFILATLASGAGLLVYVLMWWLMPAVGSTGAHAASDWNLHALRRSVTGCQVAGVCAGLGAYTPIPAWLWRVAFVALIFAGGVGLLAYALLWLLVPRADAAVAGAGSQHSAR